MNNYLQIEIIKDQQIKKFCAYGFLKNLKFFEPYLLIFLMRNNINLFEIGILITVREIIVNLFEIPSGIIADYFGRKKEMYFCFSFYIMSFLIFFFVNNFTQAIIGMIFFGLAEAFRSGTHKAMIYTYLDYKNWQNEKAFVYGRTRAFSLIGSAISSVFGIIIILNIESISYIFLFSILPYILDLLLIMSYPKFLDKMDKTHNTSLKEMVNGIVKSFYFNKKLKFILIEEGIAEASFSYVKDLIQPILEIIIITTGFTLFISLSSDDNLKIILGIVYAILNLFGSYFSKKAYLLKSKRTSLAALNIIHLSFAFTCVLLALFLRNYLIVCIGYIVMYILHSLRKPIFVDEIDNNIDKSNRATIISASAQLKSLFLMIFAPILGYVGDNFGIEIIMVSLFMLLIISYPLSKSK